MSKVHRKLHTYQESGEFIDDKSRIFHVLINTFLIIKLFNLSLIINFKLFLSVECGSIENFSVSLLRMDVGSRKLFY
jgi:hypothetical protein